jgi:hypothetical protein
MNTENNHEQLLTNVAAAQVERDAAAQDWDRYNGNNPNPPALKRLRTASQALECAIEVAKAAGAMERTEAELLSMALDKAHPNARSNEVVAHEGRQYRRKFVPTGDKNRPWDRFWEPLPEA